MFRFLNRSKDSSEPVPEAAGEYAPLIAALHSPDGLQRQQARRTLVDIGAPVVGALVQVLSSPDWHARWEAAKALAEIADPAAAPALTAALVDDEFEVRWLAAEGLIALGQDNLGPLMQALVSEAESVRLRQGAHHVLRVLAREGLRPELADVLVALESIEPALTVPPVAEAAWRALEASTLRTQP